MYDLIYNFIKDNLFNGNNNFLSQSTITLFNNQIDLNVYFSHTLTIVSIGLIFVFCIIFIKWFFKLGAGLLTLR